MDTTVRYSRAAACRYFSNVVFVNLIQIGRVSFFAIVASYCVSIIIIHLSVIVNYYFVNFSAADYRPPALLPVVAQTIGGARCFLARVRAGGTHFPLIIRLTVACTSAAFSCPNRSRNSLASRESSLGTMGCSSRWCLYPVNSTSCVLRVSGALILFSPYPLCMVCRFSCLRDTKTSGARQVFAPALAASIGAVGRNQTCYFETSFLILSSISGRAFRTASLTSAYFASVVSISMAVSISTANSNLSM